MRTWPGSFALVTQTCNRSVSIEIIAICDDSSPPPPERGSVSRSTVSGGVRVGTIERLVESDAAAGHRPALRSVCGCATPHCIADLQSAWCACFSRVRSYRRPAEFCDTAQRGEAAPKHSHSCVVGRGRRKARASNRRSSRPFPTTLIDSKSGLPRSPARHS